MLGFHTTLSQTTAHDSYFYHYSLFSFELEGLQSWGKESQSIRQLIASIYFICIINPYVYNIEQLYVATPSQLYNNK